MQRNTTATKLTNGTSGPKVHSSNGNLEISGEDTKSKGLNLINLVTEIALHISFAFSLYYVYEQGSIRIQTIYLTVCLYLITAFSLSAGYHRLYAHTTYKAFFLYRLITLYFGAGALLGSVVTWCRYHRAHHRFLNKQLDPMNSKKGFFHSHIGWRLLNSPEYLKKNVDISDVEKDTFASIQHTLYYVFAILSGFALPAAIASTWNDMKGGLLIAGVIRVFIVHHAFLLTTSLAHVHGVQKFTDENSSRDSWIVSLLTLGEGNQNFNHEFPKDYRLGIKFWDLDPTKWIIYSLSKVGITSSLMKTNTVDIIKANVQFKQRKINEKKAALDFGPEEERLPIESWDSINDKVKNGKKLIVIDGIVHDAEDFIPQHPGGRKILEARIGKDATIAFNGGLYRHSKAARNILATLRVSRLPPQEANARTEADYFRRENE